MRWMGVRGPASGVACPCGCGCVDVDLPTPRIRRAILERDKFQCQHCFTRDSLEVHHIVPLVRGGSNDLSNLLTLCRQCNMRETTNIAQHSLRPIQLRYRIGRALALPAIRHGQDGTHRRWHQNQRPKPAVVPSSAALTLSAPSCYRGPQDGR